MLPITTSDLAIRLEALLRHEGYDDFEKQMGAAPWQPDLIARGPAGTLCIDLSVMKTVRMLELEGRLARGVLLLKRYGTAPGMIAIGVPAASERVQSRVAAFMRAHAPLVGWALVGFKGDTVICVPGARPQRVEGTTSAPVVHESTAPTARGLFSDLNRLMLKLLLGDAMGDGVAALIGGPVRTATELAAAASVSLATATRFVKRLRRLGHLPAGGALTLRRAESLIDQLFAHQRSHPLALTPARSLFGDPLDALLTQATSFRFALGGTTAARRRGLLHAPEDTPVLHIDAPPEVFIRQWNLDRCDPGDATVLLARSGYPESVFRVAAPLQEGGPPIVDVLQIALDGLGRPYGWEQAQFILEYVSGELRH